MLPELALNRCTLPCRFWAWSPCTADINRIHGMHCVDISLVIPLQTVHWMMLSQLWMVLMLLWMSLSCSFMRKSWLHFQMPNFCWHPQMLNHGTRMLWKLWGDPTSVLQLDGLHIGSNVRLNVPGAANFIFPVLERQSVYKIITNILTEYKRLFHLRGCWSTTGLMGGHHWCTFWVFLFQRKTFRMLTKSEIH